MSEKIIICATTGSKSKKSRQQIINPVMEIFKKRTFGTYELMVWPANHPQRTPEKHQMALSQATYATQVGTKVSLIFVIPNGYSASHLSEVQALAQSNGIHTRMLSLEDVLTGKLIEE